MSKTQLSTKLEDGETPSGRRAEVARVDGKVLGLTLHLSASDLDSLGIDPGTTECVYVEAADGELHLCVETFDGLQSPDQAHESGER